MANPYHDAEGKFCSKGEMQEAIDQAALSGAHATYLRLRADFDETTRAKEAGEFIQPSHPEKITLSEMKDAAHRGVETGYSFGKGIEQLVDSLQQDHENQKGVKLPLGKVYSVEYYNGNPLGNPPFGTNPGEIWQVFKTDSGQMFRLSGSRNSYEGKNWQDYEGQPIIEEVSSETKTVTIYSPVS